MAQQTAAEKRRWRLLRASAKAAAAEFAARDKAVAGLETKVATFDPFESEMADLFADDGEGEAPVDYHGLPRTRSSALYHQTATYSTGRACIDGHHSPRETSSGRCLECKAEGDRDRAEIEAKGLHPGPATQS